MNWSILLAGTVGDHKLARIRAPMHSCMHVNVEELGPVLQACILLPWLACTAAPSFSCTARARLYAHCKFFYTLPYTQHALRAFSIHAETDAGNPLNYTPRLLARLLSCSHACTRPNAEPVPLTMVEPTQLSEAQALASSSQAVLYIKVVRQGVRW